MVLNAKYEYANSDNAAFPTMGMHVAIEVVIKTM